MIKWPIRAGEFWEYLHNFFFFFFGKGGNDIQMDPKWPSLLRGMKNKVIYWYSLFYQLMGGEFFSWFVFKDKKFTRIPKNVVSKFDNNSVHLNFLGLT